MCTRDLLFYCYFGGHHILTNIHLIFPGESPVATLTWALLLQHIAVQLCSVTSICKNTFATNSSKKVHFGDDFYFPLFALLKSCSGLTSVCCSLIHFFMSMDNFKSLQINFLCWKTPLCLLFNLIFYLYFVYIHQLCAELQPRIHTSLKLLNLNFKSLFVFFNLNTKCI